MCVPRGRLRRFGRVPTTTLSLLLRGFTSGVFDGGFVFKKRLEADRRAESQDKRGLHGIFDLREKGYRLASLVVCKGGFGQYLGFL